MQIAAAFHLRHHCAILSLHISTRKVAAFLMSKNRRHSDMAGLPVRLVIWFVGVIGVLSLIAGVYLLYIGKTGESALSITNGCVMGLLGLLAKTHSAETDEPQAVVGPDGGPVPTVEIPPATNDAVPEN
jgi:hypothetical protein